MNACFFRELRTSMFPTETKESQVKTERRQSLFETPA